MSEPLETVVFFEIDQPLCSLTYGTAPCQAALGDTGTRKCYNTRFTCQDPDNYNPGIVTLRFAREQEGLLAYGPLIPSLAGDISTTPGAINLGRMDQGLGAFGARESISVRLKDHPYSDHLVDKYRLERETGAAAFDGTRIVPYQQGSFWGKWLARNPYYAAYTCRVREGTVGQALADMRVREYVIERVAGPNEGFVEIVAKDAFSRVEARKAVCPPASRGYLSADITGTPASFTLQPAGIGDLDYADITATVHGHVAIGKECIEVTRAGDVCTVVLRAALNTTQEDHKQDDVVQLVVSFVAKRAHDITNTLLTVYGGIAAAKIPFAAWAARADTAGMVELYTARIAKPTPVADLAGELEEQAGFTLYPDLESGEIAFVPLRASVPTVTVDDANWIISKTLSLRRRDEKRLSQVWVYYGQIDPTKDLEEITNFRSREISPDLARQALYGSPAVRALYSRWIPTGGRASAISTGSRLVTMFGDPPIEADFDHYASRAGELSLGGYFLLDAAELQDQHGVVAPPTMAVTAIEKGADRFSIAAQKVVFAAAGPGGALTVVPIENDLFNLTLRDIWDSLYAPPVSGQNIRFLVEGNVFVGSTSPSVAAVYTGDWPVGVNLSIEFAAAARFQGCGGKGGSVTVEHANGEAGQDGGDALVVTYPITIYAALGAIWSGAGGGGASGGVNSGVGGDEPGPGGGGCGLNGGIAGFSAFGPSASPGTEEAGGLGADGVGVAPGIGKGGNGGGPGLDGQAGANGIFSGIGGAGGRRGRYVVGNSLVTWASVGDLRGDVAA